MAEVRLPAIKQGFVYTASLNFPAGFLVAGESVRAKLRRYRGQTTPDATFDSARVGDRIDLSLTALETAALAPGDYLSEMVIYVPLVPATAEIPITDVIYIIEVQPSASI